MRSDEALFEDLLQGELAAFDALYGRYEGHLFGFCSRHLADRAEAEDVLHEAFLAVLREGKAGRSVRCFRAWLFQVARNLCLNRSRSKTRTARAIAAATHTLPAAGDLPDFRLEQGELARSLQQALSQLPQPLAKLFELRASGLSYEELAQVLAIPLGTVKSRMHEMISRLREEMGR